MKITDSSQVGADIRKSQKTVGFVEECMKWQNHEQVKVSELLTVPRYADLLEDDIQTSELDKPDVERCQSGLIRSWEGWWKEMLKWIQEEREQDSGSDDEVANTTYGLRRSKRLPHLLELLFGGRKETDIDEWMR